MIADQECRDFWLLTLAYFSKKENFFLKTNFLQKMKSFSKNINA